MRGSAATRDFLEKLAWDGQPFRAERRSYTVKAQEAVSWTLPAS
jgi:hypothetical protein